jgi:hypothetical protein
LATRKAYDKVVSPAPITKTIQDEFKGFNPFNSLKALFQVLFTCFLVFLVACCMVRRQLLGLGDRLHQEHLRNFKRGRYGEWST